MNERTNKRANSIQRTSTTSSTHLSFSVLLLLLLLCLLLLLLLRFFFIIIMFGRKSRKEKENFEELERSAQNKAQEWNERAERMAKAAAATAEAASNTAPVSIWNGNTNCVVVEKSAHGGKTVTMFFMCVCMWGTRDQNVLWNAAAVSNSSSSSRSRRFDIAVLQCSHYLFFHPFTVTYNLCRTLSPSLFADISLLSVWMRRAIGTHGEQWAFAVHTS